MSVPTLSLTAHENGGAVQLDVPELPVRQRLELCSAALATLMTGRFRLRVPHVRTLLDARRLNLRALGIDGPQALS